MSQAGPLLTEMVYRVEIKQSNNLRVQAARKRRVRAPNAFIGVRCSERCWGELEPDLLQRLSASMTKRIQMVLDAEGKAIDR